MSDITSDNEFGAHRSAIMMTRLATTRNAIRLGASLAAVLVMNACSSSSDSGAVDSTATTVAATVVTTAITDDTTVTPATPADAEADADGEAGATVTPEPVDYETNPALTSAQFIPASSPDFPCAAFTGTSEFPLVPCDSGPLVTQLQESLRYAGNPDLVVDGFFGEETYDAVRSLQQFFGMYDTGVVDQVFLDQYDTVILHDEFEEDDNEDFRDDGGADFVVDGVAMTADEVIAMCTAIQDSLTAEVTDDQVLACDSVDVRISSGD